MGVRARGLGGDQGGGGVGVRALSHVRCRCSHARGPRRYGQPSLRPGGGGGGVRPPRLPRPRRARRARPTPRGGRRRWTRPASRAPTSPQRRRCGLRLLPPPPPPARAAARAAGAGRPRRRSAAARRHLLGDGDEGMGGGQSRPAGRRLSTPPRPAPACPGPGPARNYIKEPLRHRPDIGWLRL
jgi:hypothetical protein